MLPWNWDFWEMPVLRKRPLIHTQQQCSSVKRHERLFGQFWCVYPAVCLRLIGQYLLQFRNSFDGTV